MIEEKLNSQPTASPSNSILRLQLKSGIIQTKIISTRSNRKKKSIKLSNKSIKNVKDLSSSKKINAKDRSNSKEIKRSNILNKYSNS